MRTLMVFVPGILTWPGSAKNWSGKAVTWTHTHSSARAEKVEYFCGPIGRAFGQNERVRKLYRTVDQYRDGWSISLAGHSNGAAVVLTMLDLYQTPRIERLELICGACEADCEKNGLNSLLRSGRVGHAYVYVAEQDMALRLAHTLPGKILGYGILGLHGPLNVQASVAERLTMVHWPGFGHSTCWHEDNLEKTMEGLVRCSGTEAPCMDRRSGTEAPYQPA